MGVIYKITNKLDGKIYIGKTARTLEERMKEHTRGKKTYIDRAISKYGIDTFKVVVIEECNTEKELNEREIYWIDFFNCKFPNGYNMTDGGEGSLGYKAPPELSARLSEMRKGRPNTPEQRAKISAKLKGKIFSPETCAKISAAKMGHTVSDETREKLRKANLGKKASDESRAKRSASSKNKRAVKCVETGEIFASVSQAKKITSITTISYALNKPTRTAGGFHWVDAEINKLQ